VAAWHHAAHPPPEVRPVMSREQRDLAFLVIISICMLAIIFITHNL